MQAVNVIQGTSPIVLGQPHSGTYLPENVFAQLNDHGQKLLDTDWHIPQLYEGLLSNVTIVRANFSRYLIDANRDPDGSNLYPMQSTTELVPTTSFDGKPIWRVQPDKQSLSERLQNYHQPYHQALQNELARVKKIHGQVLLFDCHSIRSEIPFLFDGVLPKLNVGNNQGRTCASKFSSIVEQICQQNTHYSSIINGRFIGGWTTRHYGKPDSNTHTIQMEIAQRAYLATENPPFEFDQQKALKLRIVLTDILETLELALHDRTCR